MPLISTYNRFCFIRENRCFATDKKQKNLEFLWEILRFFRISWHANIFGLNGDVNVHSNGHDFIPCLERINGVRSFFVIAGHTHKKKNYVCVWVCVYRIANIALHRKRVRGRIEFTGIITISACLWGPHASSRHHYSHNISIYVWILYSSILPSV